jgi:hypothetical protein
MKISHRGGEEDGRMVGWKKDKKTLCPQRYGKILRPVKQKNLIEKSGKI